MGLDRDKDGIACERR
ncbi:MAG: excalibur calcium-binding domain-containing protein [Actinobacteria bacterium]|nr:excalibur calcium-binding domain-containing protein [Actinomycetota bacterium]